MKSISKVAINGNIELLQEQIQSGVDVNSTDNSGRTLLMNAVIEGRVEIAQFLIEAGADVNRKDSMGCTALHYAAQEYSLEMWKLLFENKAIVDARDENGNTLLFRAVCSARGRKEVIKLLLSFEAEKNFKMNVSPTESTDAIIDSEVRKILIDSK